MARNFVVASTQQLTLASALVAAYPFTVAGWFRQPSGAPSGVLFALGNTTTSPHRWCLISTLGAGLELQAADANPASSAPTTTLIAADTWHHAAGVCASATSRSVYLDGGGKSTDTTNRTPTVDTTNFGVVNIGGVFYAYLTGLLAEWAVWDVALTDAEVAALAKAWSPDAIRPAARIAYWKLFGNDSPERDSWKNSYDLTLVNSPVKGDHPRIYYRG